MIESSAPVLGCLIVGGLFRPKVCAGLGVLYGAGRVIYAIGYKSKMGANGRVAGAAAAAIGMLGLYGICFFEGYILTTK